MGYTGGIPGKMYGNYWYQESRCAYVRDLKQYVYKAMMHYYKLNNLYPKQVFVYRGGASEGEFRIVCLYLKKTHF